MVVAVDELMVELVEVRQEAPVARVRAIGGTEVVQVPGGRRQCLALRGPEVHRLQGGARDVLEGVRHRHEPAQDPGTALGRLIEEESRPGIAGWHRFGVDLPFLKLEGRLDAPQQRVLEGSEGCLCPDPGRDGLHEEGVLGVLHHGHDHLGVDHLRVRERLGLVLIFGLHPEPGRRVDGESELGTAGAPAQSLVEPGNGGTRTV